MLRRAQTLEPSVDHDAQPGAESLTLLHAVGREDHGLPAPDHLQNAIPQETTRARIHAGGRFVLQEKSYLNKSKFAQYLWL